MKLMIVDFTVQESNRMQTEQNHIQGPAPPQFWLFWHGLAEESLLPPEDPKKDLSSNTDFNLHACMQDIFRSI